MEVQIACLADAANVTAEGKINILGQFDVIWGKSEPIVWTQLYFVARVLVSAGDGIDLRFRLQPVNEDGELVGPPQEFTGRNPGSLLPGIPAGAVFIVGVTNSVYPKFGTYGFQLYADDHLLTEVPLHVRPARERPPGR